jgi:hypothetical protein
MARSSAPSCTTFPSDAVRDMIKESVWSRNEIQWKEDWRLDQETFERLCWWQVVSHNDDRIQNAIHDTPTPRCSFYTPKPIVPATTSQVFPQVRVPVSEVSLFSGLTHPGLSIYFWQWVLHRYIPPPSPPQRTGECMPGVLLIGWAGLQYQLPCLLYRDVARCSLQHITSHFSQIQII